ncbi:FAD:protein FMN transferase [Streptomyces sp. NBC_01497]|uniref:FAD:protein FMN transferase n=1 Tax=Streptomyces sp. NBC_01497 TaxID=2903885 RepID=UPI003FCD0383
MVQRHPGRLDPSGLVQGWATEASSQLLHEADARHLGQRRRRAPAPRPTGPGAPWRIGIAHPLHPGAVATVVTARHDLAVATSGTAERGAHIFDQHNASPATAFASLTLIGPRLTLIDTFATAAFSSRRREGLGGNTERLRSTGCPGRRRRMANVRLQPIRA